MTTPKAHLRSNIIKDKLFFGIILVLSFAVAIPLIWIVGYIIVQGVQNLSPVLFIKDQNGGGILNAILGTIIVTTIAALIATPIGIMTGIYIAEYQNKFSHFLKVIVELIQSIPSIVMGILAFIWFVVPLRSFSALSGSIALALIMIPVVVKNTEENIRLIPLLLKEAAYALGAPKHEVILKILVPCSISGISTGVLVGVSRIMGETAPLLFTAFGTRIIHINIFRPMETLPTLIFKYVSSPVEEWIKIAWAAALILSATVFLLNLISSVLIKRWKVKL
ncbi:phosphate ABC transporter permease PstA [Thermospira aquatica]|uniref:Phosphate transport system permease protein PstA n=1 Tax=Thermospira aquatica TaxID=2828656 RepID=A0AAX3BBN6_9SPIR|nr:phosphate ABC transporter permease PstA [Thermospira aquatica]URA09638.1 phosphate ABC transporter permease PstA [Thermospira aquatica]